MNNKLFIIMLALLSSCAYAQYYNYFTDGTGTIYIPINTTAGQNYTLYIDPTASTSYAANGANVFQFYDGFSGGALSGSWTCTGTCTVSGGEVAVTSNGGWLQSTSNYDNNTEVIMRVKTLVTPDAGRASVFGFGPAVTNKLIVGFSSGLQNAYVNNVAVGCTGLLLSTSYSTFSLWRNSTANTIMYQDDISKCTAAGATAGGDVIGDYNYQSAQTTYIDWVALRNRSSTEPNVTSSGTAALYALDIRAGATNTNQVIKVTGLSITGNVSVYDNVSNFTVTARDNITGLAINTFNASITWNGTSQFYSTTSGQIVTNITRNSELINITLRSNNYLNLTNTSFNITSQFDGRLQPTQFEVDFNVSELITNNIITNYTINFQGSSNISGVNPRINVSVGTYNITFLNRSYFNKTIYSVSINSNTTVNFSGVYQYLINVSVRNAYNNSNESTFTAILNSTLYNFSNTSTTTNGTILFPWINDTTVYVNITNASTVSSINAQITNLGSYHNPAVVNVTANSSTINSLLFYVYDEITNLLLNTITSNLYLTGSATSYNYTTITGIVNATLIYPQTYLITYSSPAYNTRNYAFTLVNGSSTTILLYLRPTGNSSVVLITLTDQNQRTVVNATVYSRIKNLSNNQYYISEMCLTDNNGQCQISADVSTTTYRASTIYNFLVYYNGIVVGTSGDTVLSGNSYAMQVNIGTNALANSYSFANIVYSNITYNNVTQLYNVTYFDPTSIISNACLNAYRQIGAYTTLVNSTCSTLFTNTLSIGSNNSIGDADYAQFVIYFNGNIYLLTTSPTTKNNSSGSNFSPYFLIFVFIGVLITIFLGTKSLATTSIVMMAGVAFILIRISTTILPITAAIGLLVMAVVVYFRLKE